jgi:glycerophosphoryl diester phosphodiesterase
VVDGDRLLLGCDNNFPNKGRNPDLADDTELIVVKVPGLRSHH